MTDQYYFALFVRKDSGTRDIMPFNGDDNSDDDFNRWYNSKEFPQRRENLKVIKKGKMKLEDAWGFYFNKNFSKS